MVCKFCTWQFVCTLPASALSRSSTTVLRSLSDTTIFSLPQTQVHLVIVILMWIICVRSTFCAGMYPLVLYHFADIAAHVWTSSSAHLVSF